jgi:hypothetical protein
MPPLSSRSGRHKIFAPEAANSRSAGVEGPDLSRRRATMAVPALLWNEILRRGSAVRQASPCDRAARPAAGLPIAMTREQSRTPRRRRCVARRRDTLARTRIDRGSMRMTSVWCTLALVRASCVDTRRRRILFVIPMYRLSNPSESITFQSVIRYTASAIDRLSSNAVTSQ